MSFRLAPAISSSSFRGTRLEGLLGTGGLIVCRRHVPPDASGSARVQLRGGSELRSAPSVSGWRRMERRGGEVWESGGRRATECSVSSWSGVGGGSAGADQPSSSSSPSSSSVLPSHPPATGPVIRFCSKCGGATEEKIPIGETVMRFVCTQCGAVHYQNPKMVVGCLVEHEEKVLLCRRNCEPAYGLWTLPAGYLEIGESSAEGAARETLEEACADVQVLGLFALLDIPFIGQVVTVFRARLKNLHFAPGPESLECALFKLDEIPFENLAFSSIHLTLKMTRFQSVRPQRICCSRCSIQLICYPGHFLSTFWGHVSCTTKDVRAPTTFCNGSCSNVHTLGQTEYGSWTWTCNELGEVADH